MKKSWLILPLILAMLFASACSKSSPEAERNYDMAGGVASAPQAAPAPMAPAEMAAEEMLIEAPKTDEAGWGVDGAASAADSGNSYGGHKIIRNAGLGIETREFDLHVAYIRQKVVEMGGYVSSSYTSGRKPEKYGEGGRYANISCRIPQERMDAFLVDARGLATVTYENSSGEDITASYFDTESRLNIYESQRERIMKLLDQAETMEDIINLETELSRLTYEIESLTTQLKRWDDLVDFATVNIDVMEIPPSFAVSSDDSVGTRINEGLNRTLSGLAVFFEDLFVFLITSFPVLLLLGLIAVAVIIIYRRHRRKPKPESNGAKNNGEKKKRFHKYGSDENNKDE